ncbi:MAG TPA: DUF3551 domain-containing protein [Xanthobacteraceae bacterium]|jgi:hypothetical protein
MRCGIPLAVAMMAFSATSAHAQEWCGYAAHANSVIECGYTTAQGCENVVGKGGMCFINPDLALNVKVEKPAISLRRGQGHG